MVSLNNNYSYICLPQTNAPYTQNEKHTMRKEWN